MWGNKSVNLWHYVRRAGGAHTSHGWIHYARWFFLIFFCLLGKYIFNKSEFSALTSFTGMLMAEQLIWTSAGLQTSLHFVRIQPCVCGHALVPRKKRRCALQKGRKRVQCSQSRRGRSSKGQEQPWAPPRATHGRADTHVLPAHSTWGGWQQHTWILKPVCHPAQKKQMLN